MGLATERRFTTYPRWSDYAAARTTRIQLALFSRVTILAMKLRHGGQSR
jgi:hypothetical protein